MSSPLQDNVPATTAALMVRGVLSTDANSTSDNGTAATTTGELPSVPQAGLAAAAAAATDATPAISSATPLPTAASHAAAALLSPRSALAGQKGSVKFTRETGTILNSPPPQFSSPPKPKPLKELTASEFRDLTPSYYQNVYKGHLRTPVAIRSDVVRNLTDQGLQSEILGETCLHVFESHDEFKAALDKLHGDININAGAVALNWGKARVRLNTTTKGPSMSVLCDAAGKARGKTTKKTDCKWGFDYELSTEGWMEAGPTKDAIKAYKRMCDNGSLTKNVSKIHEIHNHPLPKTKAESHAKPSLRNIPEELLPMADDLNRTAFSNAAIYDFLLRQCELKDLEVNFTKKDVDNRYRHSAAEATLDCSDLIEFLQERWAEDASLPFNHTIDSDGSLNRVLFVTKEGIARWKDAGGKVLLYDTKHGTNRYGMKLGCLSYVDETGTTQVLACSIARFEDEDTFRWVFENFADLFESAPEVIFTDSDKAMAKAIKAEWPSTKQLLCTWHLYKNFYEHFRTLFAGTKNKAKWNEVCDLFWQLCKLSDVMGQLTFDSRMGVLSNIILPLIESSDRTEKKKQGDRDFLTSLGERCHQWAACYTWLNTTYGIHSTQRAEAINSAIKQFCSKTSKIVNLVHDLERMSSRHHLKAEVESLRHLFHTSSGNRANIHPSAKALTADIEDYAASIVEAQAGQIGLYKTIDSPVPDLSSIHGWKPFQQHESVYCVVINNPQDYSTDEGARRDADYGIGDSIEFTSPLDDGWEFEELRSQLTGGTTQQQGGTTTSSTATSTATSSAKKPRAPPKHWTSVSQCTCLFQYCYGLPCRHQFHVMLRENYFGKIEYDLFWKKMTAEARETRAAGQGRADPVSFLSSTQLDFGSTAAEQLPQLQTAASNFVKYASQTPALTSEAHKLMSNFCGKEAAMSVKNAPLAKKQNDPRFQSSDPTNPGNKGAKKRKRIIANQKRKEKQRASKNSFTGK